VRVLPATAVTKITSLDPQGLTASPTRKREPAVTVTEVASCALGEKDPWLTVSVLTSRSSSLLTRQMAMSFVWCAGRIIAK